ncbi:terminase small subunit [Lacrimispora sp.]|uniref:terminase small subunit n=1 Tax=Lacrimispora sp. TaxID=2719234 RepID=UPI002FDA0AD1
MALTAKQKIFADEYLIDLNAARAYKVAYPKVKKDETAAVNSSRMLRNAKVEDYIQKRMKDREERTEISQDMVLKELAKIGLADVTDFVTIESDGTYKSVKVKTTDDMPRDKLGAIAGIKVFPNFDRRKHVVSKAQIPFTTTDGALTKISLDLTTLGFSLNKQVFLSLV